MLQSETSLYLAGLFLRFGVPLGLTIILAWLLRNMDMQWLEQADEDKGKDHRIEGQLPDGCWIIHNLSKDNHVDTELQDACWKVRVRFEGILPDQCLDCQYFQEGVLEDAA
jgi:cytochrome c-type biogenesis protein CcmE